MSEDGGTNWGKVRKLFSHEVWDLDLASLSAERSFLVRVIRVGQLVIRGFKEDDLFVHASALTFVMLTSLVPMLAVVFALLRGFGFGQDQINSLMAWKDSMPTEFQAFVDNVIQIVISTNFSALGWIGVAFVILTAVMVLGSVEVSFNRVWGVTTPRAMIRQVANYTSLLVLVPFL
ncbi:MAG: YhjD/YihY/BrkB family envelope integrity protein, partial [Lentisphaerota bacterium]